MLYSLILILPNLLALLYNLGISIVRTFLPLLSLFNKKINLFIKGRATLSEIYTNIAIPTTKKKIWIHCASLGEFEQGRPIIEALRKTYPDAYLVVTFFSPSGYEVRKNYSVADQVMYMDYDTPLRANKFVSWLQPDLAVFVKYEFWYNHLKALHKAGTTTIFIGTIFQERQPFFKWYGGLHRQMLDLIQHIFVQDQHSKDLLDKLGIHHTTIAGDPRFDQAFQTSLNVFENDTIKNFIHKKVLIAGSTWKDDVQLLKAWYDSSHPEYQLIIAPHQVDDATLEDIKATFSSYKIMLYTDATLATNADILILNTFGMLSKIYRYANVVWIGGGWNNTGIHNSVEAAVYGKPLFWGPRYSRYREARDLIALDAAISINTADELYQLTTNENALFRLGNNALNYVHSQLGATKKIMDYIKLKCFSNNP